MQLQSKSRGMLSSLIALPVSLFAVPALAGPPYATDDPLPADYGKWEIITRK